MLIQKNSAKAIIFQNNQVLMVKKVYEDGSIIFTLPGGTQELGEPLSTTVVREVYEETGANISPVKLLHVYEHQRQSRTNPERIRHKIEFAFLCELTSSYHPHNGEQPDSHQTAVEWVTLDELPQLNLNPSLLAQILHPNSKLTENYLGLSPKEN